jgi:hypothetical protein
MYACRFAHLRRRFCFSSILVSITAPWPVSSKAASSIISSAEDSWWGQTETVNRHRGNAAARWPFLGGAAFPAGGQRQPVLGFPTKNGGCVIWAYRPISIRRTCGEGRSGAAFPADGHFGVSIRGLSTCGDADLYRRLSALRCLQPKEPDRRFPVMSSLVPPRTTPSSGATAKGNQRSWFSRTPPRMLLVKVAKEPAIRRSITRSFVA